MSGLKLEAQIKEAEEALRQAVGGIEDSDKTNDLKATESTDAKQPIPEEKDADVSAEKEPGSGLKEPIEEKKAITETGEETWEHRYNVLKGKEYAEVPRMAAEIRELKTEKNDLRTQLSELQKTITELQSKVSSKENESSAKELDDVFSVIKEQLGEPATDALNKLIEMRAKDIAKITSRSFEDKARELEGKVKENSEKLVYTDKGLYLKELKSLIPELEKKNSSLAWKRWLSKPAPLGRGRTYQDLLDEANSAYDSSGVAEIFTAAAKEGIFDNGAHKIPKPNLDEVIEPGSPKSSKTSKFEEKKFYKRSEIDKFYKDVVQGKYSEQEKERLALDEEYTAALLEGRVR